MRVTESTYWELSEAADTVGRSVSEEIESRLYEWAAWRKTKLDIDEMAAAARIQAIRKAGFQIVRETGGNVTVNVSPEMLLSTADGILRSGFVAAEDMDKSPMEIAVERAVERALEKVGLLRRDKGAA